MSYKQPGSETSDIGDNSDEENIEPLLSPNNLEQNVYDDNGTTLYSPDNFVQTEYVEKGNIFDGVAVDKDLSDKDPLISPDSNCKNNIFRDSPKINEKNRDKQIKAKKKELLEREKLKNNLDKFPKNQDKKVYN